MSDNVIPNSRPLGARYRLDERDGSWWEIGWDRPLGTFYAQHHSPVPFDPHTPADLLAWHGTALRELPTIEALAARLTTTIPDDIADELTLDATAHPHLADPPFLGAAHQFISALDRVAPADDHHLRQTTTTLPGAGELGPVHPQVSVGDPTPTPPSSSWLVPGHPLAKALRTLSADHLGDEHSLARDVGLDPDLVHGVLNGTIEGIPIERVAEVCNALQRSPRDVWSSELGRQIDHSSRADRWPDLIGPDDAGGDGGTATYRPIDRLGANIAGADTAPPSSALHGPTTLQVTRYRQTGVLEVDAAGAVRRVDDLDAPADSAAEYHFAFQRLAGPHLADVDLTAEAFARGCPPGHDIEPRLRPLLDRIDRTEQGADLIRLADPSTGAEQWLGRETPFDSWQTWDDPCRYYPGDPADVLEHAGLDELPATTEFPLPGGGTDIGPIADPGLTEFPVGASLEAFAFDI